MNYRKIKLRVDKERSLMNFHPWVFSGAIEGNTKSFEEGEIVEVYSANDRYLATGHFHHGSIMVRILSFEKVIIDEIFWLNKFQDAFNLRKLLDFKDTDAYRLINAEGDYLPGLIIDIYGTCAVIQAHSNGMSKAVEHAAAALTRIKGLSIEIIYARSSDAISKHDNNKSTSYFLKGNAAETIIKENGHLFKINWVEGQKTGFFLDQRDNRQLLADYSSGKKVLNTFCYSGGFSVYALKAGAIKVDSVDSSKKAIEWTDENIALNFPGGCSHESHVADVFEFLKDAPGDYEVIVLDPPAFAKHLSAVNQAVVGYRNLNYEAIKKIQSGGVIFTFSCSQAIDRQLFRKTIFTAAAKARRKVRILHQLSQGPDHPVNIYHPEGEYLKGLVLQVE